MRDAMRVDAHGNRVVHDLPRELLAEVPAQLLEWMTQRGITPNPPTPPLEERGRDPAHDASGATAAVSPAAVATTASWGCQWGLAPVGASFGSPVPHVLSPKDPVGAPSV